MIIILAAVVVSLSVCWGIGQALHKEEAGDSVENQNIEDNQMEAVTNVDVETADSENSEKLASFADSIVFEGDKETSDNPWNITAGIIDVDDEKECIFLTPNTAANITGLESVNELEISYMLHPWVKEDSDGAGIIVSVFDKDNILLHEDNITVDADDDWKNYRLDKEQCKNANAFKLSCNNGGNNDDKCDWVIVKIRNLVDAEDKERKSTDGEDMSLQAKGIAKGGGYELVSGFDGEKPVLERGEEAWETSDVLNPSVIKWNGKYYNYYSGCDGETWRTGLAVSEDGINWVENSNNPVLDLRKDEWDSSYIAANGSAVVFQNKVYYYYQGLDKDTNTSAIGLAISEDGVNFDEKTRTYVLGGGQDWESAGIGDPYVIEFDGKLYMYYLGQNELGIQSLGLASSTNGTDWIEYKNNPIMDVGAKGAFDEAGLGEPSVIYKAPYFYMVYTGRNANEQRNIGIAVSSDGVTWKKHNYEGIVDLFGNTWNNQVICDTTLMEDDDGSILVWYGGGNVPSPDENLNGNIGLCRMKFDGIDDSTSFNANDAWESYNVSVRDFVKGSYDIEGDAGDRYVWCNDEVSVILKREDGKNNLVVSGYLPFDLHNQAGAQNVELSFYVEGSLVKQQNFTQAEVFEITLEDVLSDIGSDYFELKIKASASVNPKKSGLSDDERDLSYMLKGIRQN